MFQTAMKRLLNFGSELQITGFNQPKGNQMRRNKVTRQTKLLLCFQKEESYCLHDFRNYQQKSLQMEIKYRSCIFSNGISSSSAPARATEVFSSFRNSGSRVAIDLDTSLPKIYGLQSPHCQAKQKILPQFQTSLVALDRHQYQCFAPCPP